MGKLGWVVAWLLLTPSAWATQSVWLGQTQSGPLASATEYQDPQGDGLGEWGSLQIANRSILPSSGTVTNLVVLLTVAPQNGAGAQSFTYTLFADGLTTGLTCAISEDATSCTDTSNTATVSAGQTLSVQSVPANTPTVAIPTWSMVFNSTTTSESVLMAAGTGNSADTRYFKFHGDEGTGSTTIATQELVVPTSGTFKNLYVEKTDPGVGNTFIWTVLENVSSAGVTCTLTSGQTECSDTTNSFTVVAGDLVTVQFTQTGTPTASNSNRGITFVSDTEGEFLFGLSDTGNSCTGAAPCYVLVAGGNTVDTTTETEVDEVANAMTMKAIRVVLNTTPGAGNSYDFTLRDDVAGTALTCQIADSATTCNLSTDVSVALNSLIATEIQPTSGPSAAALRIGYVGFLEPATTRRTWLITKKEAPCDSWLRVVPCGFPN